MVTDEDIQDAASICIVEAGQHSYETGSLMDHAARVSAAIQIGYDHADPAVEGIRQSARECMLHAVHPHGRNSLTAHAAIVSAEWLRRWKAAQLQLMGTNATGPTLADAPSTRAQAWPVGRF